MSLGSECCTYPNGGLFEAKIQIHIPKKTLEEFFMNTVNLCEELVKDIYEKFDASHDFQHIQRVRNNALEILESEEQADKELVLLSVLLHDVSDPKYSKHKELEHFILEKLPIDEEKKEQIQKIIKSVSFNGGNELPAESIEAKIVRDADRLDAIGAIGIARTFAYGGAKGRKLYDSSEKAREEMSEQEYRAKATSSVTHFYEKLLKLSDGMLTQKGQALAKERHQFMIQFLEQMKKEVGEEI